MATPNKTILQWGRIFQSSKFISLFSINSESRRPVDQVGSTNLLEKCFERLREMILRSEDVPSVSSETNNINKVDLDMLFHSGKSQATANAETGDISLSKYKNISKGTQEMSILQKDESLKNNNHPQHKTQDNSPPKDKLILKGENPDDILFFPEKETEKIPINPPVILSDMEKGYLTFSGFIYNNPNGK